MAAVTTAPGLPVSQMRSESSSLSTLPDPRSSCSSPDVSRSNSIHHPDLNTEVATLSNKLINAINHQTSLDDTLSQTRHELDSSRERVRQLELAIQEHEELISSGVLVRRTDVEDKTVSLMANLADEKKQRGVVEKDKRGIEQELETLTSALFEEANEMVAAARKERDATERRNEQLRVQLNDAELLLVSHQEQLAELKTVMQHMSSEREDSELNTTTSTAPSTPGLQSNESMTRIFDALHISPITPGGDDISPAPPTSFSHLLHPILRNDLPAYDDFRSLLQMSRKSAPPSRVTSASYAGLNVVNLANLTGREQVHRSSQSPSNGSTSSLPQSVTCHSSPISPNTPASTNSPVSSRDAPLSVISLKETRFYKRVLTEDIEPTLRLDAAPGLSWLARRTVINSMCEGSMVVEPMPATAKLYDFPCSLCGEIRHGDEYARTHRFRTNENESAQRYPLCPYCLSRMRASCDFLGFLRMVKDGHWRTDGAEAETTAWEESVRLRECMFWARIGGGVVPAFIRARESPRSSVEEGKPHHDHHKLPVHPSSQAVEENPSVPRLSPDPFYSNEKRVSIGNTRLSQSDSQLELSENRRTTKDTAVIEDKTSAARGEDDTAIKDFIGQSHEDQGSRYHGTVHSSIEAPEDDQPKPSVAIPGSFIF